MPIPRVIHFIWAGGEKPFPNHEVLKRWQEKNPEWQIILWVDKESTPESVFESYRNDDKYLYLEAGENAPSVEEVVEEQLKSVGKDFKSILFADVTAVMAPPIRYEINRFRRNYGCSSDLLRYKILAKYGGAYFDSDIDPGEALSKAYNLTEEKPRLYVNYNSQNKRGAVGNDAFICSLNHPLMLGLVEQVEKNYKEEKLNDPNDYDDTDMPWPDIYQILKSYEYMFCSLRNC